MTETRTATAARTVTVGQGTSVHAVQTGTTSVYTVCGAEGRGYRQSPVRPSVLAVTCRACLKAQG